ncbi:MAG TPA: Hpt domain-containing protein [Propionibacteriaceae bacterium]
MTSGEGERLDRARQAVREIGAAALRSNVSRVEVLAEAVEGVGRGGLSDDERAAAVAVAHQLVGSAGTFGYGHVSTLARQLELFLSTGHVDPAGPPSTGLTAARAALVEIRHDLRREPDDAD